MYFDRYAEDHWCLSGGTTEVQAVHNRVVLFTQISGIEKGDTGHGWSQNKRSDHQITAINYYICTAKSSYITLDY